MVLDWTYVSFGRETLIILNMILDWTYVPFGRATLIILSKGNHSP